MSVVLVVEDEETYRDALEFVLRKEGFEVKLVANGPDALTEFERSGADLILLDLMLPGLSGTDVCSQIRQTSSGPSEWTLTAIWSVSVVKKSPCHSRSTNCWRCSCAMLGGC